MKKIGARGCNRKSYWIKDITFRKWAPIFHSCPMDEMNICGTFTKPTLSKDMQEFAFKCNRR